MKTSRRGLLQGLMGLGAAAVTASVATKSSAVAEAKETAERAVETIDKKSRIIRRGMPSTQWRNLYSHSGRLTNHVVQCLAEANDVMNDIAWVEAPKGKRYFTTRHGACTQLEYFEERVERDINKFVAQLDAGRLP